MWGRKSKVAASESEAPSPLKAAMHAARIEAAQRTGVVVDLRHAERVTDFCSTVQVAAYGDVRIRIRPAARPR
jgi:hypothetical protein